ncbi:MAG: putative rane protein [Bacteroidetes bacterium]|jgi:uncharacterized protein YoxC|nr:putative rane protein [Bacteroidota bacterium]
MENLGILLIAVAVLLVAAFIIPVLLQLQRTAKSLSLTLQLLNQNLPGILKNVEEMTANANRTTTIVAREVEELSLTIRKLQGTLGLIVGVEEIVRRNLHLAFAHKVRTSLAVAKGARVFLDYLLRKRRPETDCR